MKIGFIGLGNMGASLAKAVEQLANEKASVRLGGVYTLVGLADEWLADDNLNQDKRKEEGQVIINNLCSYIRSPFPLAAKINELLADSEPADYIGDFISDQATLRGEQEVRQTIFTEISLRVKKNRQEQRLSIWTMGNI